MEKKKVMLVILDGLGFGAQGKGDAFYQANCDYLKGLLDRNDPKVSHLKTHGEAVGLPKGQMGGSEAGHITIGAGRAVKLLLTLINDEIEAGKIKTNEILKALFSKAKMRNRIHFLGMTSDGGVHSFLPHLYGLIDLAKDYGIENIYNHCILDGRDVGLRTAPEYLEDLQKHGEITSLAGRFYTMDRDKNWDRTQASYQMMTDSDFTVTEGWKTYLQDYYKSQKESDYYLQPALFDRAGQIQPGDVVINWNFRTDRERQISAAFCDKDFAHFERPFVLSAEDYGIFGNYYDGAPKPFQFEREPVKNGLGEMVSLAGKTQLRITETEKFNHVTFFFSGEHKEPFGGEDRVLIPSPKCPNYRDKPEMSAREVTQKAVELISEKDYDFILYNYANPDMVGHSGDLMAAIKAVETVNECAETLVSEALKEGYDVILTADHGNAEEMLYPNGEPSASHSQNLVPFRIVSNRPELQEISLHEKGTLQDIAPTILDMLGIETPSEMTGKSLIINKGS